MRTTLTIEPDVAQKLKRRMAQKKLSLKRVVNDTLRAGLAASSEEKLPPFVVKPHSFQFRPGIDPDRLNQLLDELEVEDFLRKQSR